MLRALIITLLIAFFFYLVVELGFVRTGLVGDRSYISYVILFVYFVATLHWLWLARELSKERRWMDKIEVALQEARDLPDLEGSRIGFFMENLKKKSDRSASLLVETFGDEMMNRHALGHFISEVLLKLGLVGTVVGFILMLLPIGEMDSFDPTFMREMLTSMSGGMSVALYTTLAGLVTSTLLKAQYYMLDASLAEMINRLTVSVEIYLDPDAS
ncbi:MAG: hypothetical protein CL917_11845 [Deltaproteobacteria bacterium]|nr:hypothetical protein [Deltaproteobacteria bacterium]